MTTQSKWIIESRGGLPTAEASARIADLVATLQQQSAPRLILHAHGGLVDRASALNSAEGIDGTFSQLSGWERAYLIWNTSFWDAVKPGLRACERDHLARQTHRHTRTWIEERTSAIGGAAAHEADVGDPPLASEQEIRARLRQHREANARGEPDEVGIRRELKSRLSKDEDFMALTDRMELIARGGASAAASLDEDAALESWSNLTDEVRQEIVGRTRSDPEENAVRAVVYARLGLAAVRIVVRFLRGRDHGLQATTLEELVREFYLDLMGAAVWGQMKDDAKSHFETEDGAGSLLLRGLHAIAESGKPVELVVVAHSAGSILALHLLRKALGVSSKVTIKLVFWAAAVTHRTVAKLLDQQAIDRLSRFAMLSLTDQAEKSDPLDHEVPGDIYPRSLLYLISGILEPDLHLFPHADAPLLGMERHRTIRATRLTGQERADLKHVKSVLSLKKFKNAAWTCPCNMDCWAKSHGSFSCDAVVHATTVRIVQSDFGAKPACPGAGSVRSVSRKSTPAV